MSDKKPPILESRQDIIDTIARSDSYVSFCASHRRLIESALWRCAWLDDSKRKPDIDRIVPAWKDTRIQSEANAEAWRVYGEGK